MGRNRDRSGSAKASGQILLHLRRLVARGGSLNGGRNGRVAAAGAGLEACAVTVRGTTNLGDRGTGFGPDVDVVDIHVGAGRTVGTLELDGAALHAVGGGAGPVDEAEVGELDAVPCDGLHGGPVLLYVQAVGVGVADKVLKGAVADGAGTAVGLDHHHLVGVGGVDVAVDDLGDGDVGTEGAEGGTAGPVAVDVLDEDVLAGGLDGDALVLVGNHDVVDVDVVGEDVHAVETAGVASTDGQVVDLGEVLVEVN